MTATARQVRPSLNAAEAAASRLARLPSIKCSLLGDSLSNRDQPDLASGTNGPRVDGIGILTEILSRGRLSLHTCRATAGFTVAQIAATHVQEIIADAPNVVFEMSGTNDIYGPATPENAQAIFDRRRDTIWVPLIAAGILVVACIPPASASRTSTLTSEQHRAARQYAALIRAASTLYPGQLLIADMQGVMASSTGANEGVDITCYQATNTTYTHQNDTGAIKMAMERVRVMESIGIGQAVPGSLGTLSAQSIGCNSRGNGSNASGTNGAVLGAGVSGTAPDDWTCNVTGTTTATVTPGAVARTDGRPGQLVQVAVTIGAAGNLFRIYPINVSAQLLTGSSSSAIRNNSTAYRQGQVRRFSTNDYYKVIQPGTSAAAEPGTLASAVGGFVTDGSAIWQRIPNLVAGAWVRMVGEIMFTAHSLGSVSPYLQMRMYASGYANLAAGAVFEHLNTTYTNTAALGTVYSSVITGLNGHAAGAIPLNRWLMLRTPWIQITSDTAILEPMFNIPGAAGAQATFQIGYLDMQVKT